MPSPIRAPFLPTPPSAFRLPPPRHIECSFASWEPTAITLTGSGFRLVWRPDYCPVFIGFAVAVMARGVGQEELVVVMMTVHPSRNLRCFGAKGWRPALQKYTTAIRPTSVLA